MVKKYIKIICLVAKHSSVNINHCRRYYPDISSHTFSSILRVLEKNGLVEKAEEGKLVTYRKTEKFSIMKALEAVKASNRNSVGGYEAKSICEIVLKTVYDIVDPASGLTFAEMGMGVSVKELEKGFVQIEFILPFCRVASEYTMYINDAVKHISGLEKCLIRCGGCQLEDVEKTDISQFKLASSKDLLDYMR